MYALLYACCTIYTRLYACCTMYTHGAQYTPFLVSAAQVSSLGILHIRTLINIRTSIRLYTHVAQCIPLLVSVDQDVQCVPQARYPVYTHVAQYTHFYTHTAHCIRMLHNALPLFCQLTTWGLPPSSRPSVRPPCEMSTPRLTDRLPDSTPANPYQRPYIRETMHSALNL